MKKKSEKKRQIRTATFVCFFVCFTFLFFALFLLYKVILAPCIYGWRARHDITLSVFRFRHLFTCNLVVPYRSQVISGFLIHQQLFGVSVLGEPSPMLEGIGFGWAPIGFAVQSLFRKKTYKTMSSRRLLLTYSNSVRYSYVLYNMRVQNPCHITYCTSCVWEKETTVRRAFPPRQGSNHSKKGDDIVFCL